jgi:hypothetical protein
MRPVMVVKIVAPGERLRTYFAEVTPLVGMHSSDVASEVFWALESALAWATGMVLSL